MTYASCHFYSCFAKKCLCVCVCVGVCCLLFFVFFNVCLFLSFTILLLFMQACAGCLCVGCKGGKNMNATPPPFFF